MGESLNGLTGVEIVNRFSLRVNGDSFGAGMG